MARGNTRQRIQEVALELFVEQGYEKTSLREIAEVLDVTKAALYYHFKTKEDLLVSIVTDLTRPMDELIEWGAAQPRTPETKIAVLHRYSAALATAEPIFRFMQENQAALRELRTGEHFKNRMLKLAELMIEPGSSPVDQVRAYTALFTMHAGAFALKQLDGGPEEKRAAILEVAVELITRANGGE